MNFKNKNVLITGGASGIGKIMARKCLERDVKNVVIWDLNENGLNAFKSQFPESANKIHLYKANISSLEEIKNTANKVRTEVGKIDLVINNAGIVVGKYFHEHSHEDISNTLVINSAAAMHISLEFLPAMIKENSGAICNIASSAGLIANPKMSVYAASKWAVNGWSESLRLEMKQLNYDISITTIMPFFINTGMFDGVKSKLLPILEPEKTAERIMKAIENKTKILAMPLPYWFIRFSQGLLPLSAFDWVMENIFGIYDTMKNFKGRN